MTDQPKYGLWPFVLPFLAFMLISMLEVKFPSENEDTIFSDIEISSIEEGNLSQAELYVLNERRETTTHFLGIYGLKVLVTTGLLVFFWKTYLSAFPWSATWLSIGVGVVGVLLWVVLCDLGWERQIISWFSTEGISVRSQFNPFSQLDHNWQLTCFLAVRFFGLVIMVPICEELMLRGFLMRYVEDPEWWTVSLSRLSFRTLLVAPAYGVLTHPTEALAALAWFSLVTWLVQRTGNFWDAVLAHAVTNLLLGLYVCFYAQWHLW